jgi:hypothetical protein
VEVQTQLANYGYTTGRESHALSHDGVRYFGVMEVMLPDQAERDYAWAAGLRNSHDKSFPVGLVAGISVVTCYTSPSAVGVDQRQAHALHLPRPAQPEARAVGRLSDKFHSLDRRIGSYRD